jgi:hypothetical protein
MSVLFKGKSLNIDALSIEMPWPVLDAIEFGDIVFVLLDPDSYLLDPNYKKMRRNGAPAIRNLIAVTKVGAKLWEAELPEASDYYYRISSAMPLIANSFSSYRCEIDQNNGSIKSREFLK